jgi:hypothetical protein
MYCIAFLSAGNSLPHRVHTEWQWPLSGVHSIMMEKSAQAGEDWGCTPNPLSLCPTSCTLYKVCGVRYSPTEGQIHSPYFSSTPYIYSVVCHAHCTAFLSTRFGTTMSSIAPTGNAHSLCTASVFLVTVGHVQHSSLLDLFTMFIVKHPFLLGTVRYVHPSSLL